jgi:hypothetical protein
MKQWAAGILEFSIKSAIFTLVLCIGLGITAVLVIGTVAPGLKTELRKEKTRLRLVGLFTPNPQVHYRVSYIDEQFGNLKGAIDEIDLAIGLLELHGADKSVRDRYARRLEELRKKAEVKPSK